MAESPSTISAVALVALTGLTDRRHRQLADAGFFPPPVKAQYLLTPTIQGMFRYYREMNARSGGELHAVKLEKLKAETEMAQIRLSETKGEVVALPDQIDFIKKFAARLNQLLTQKIETEVPVRLLGKDIVSARAEARMIHDEVWEVCNTSLNEWTPGK